MRISLVWCGVCWIVPRWQLVLSQTSSSTEQLIEYITHIKLHHTAQNWTKQQCTAAPQHTAFHITLPYSALLLTSNSTTLHCNTQQCRALSNATLPQSSSLEWTTGTDRHSLWLRLYKQLFDWQNKPWWSLWWLRPGPEAIGTIQTLLSHHMLHHHHHATNPKS